MFENKESESIGEPAYFSKRGASRYSTISVRALDAARADGRLPFYRFSSRKILISKSDLDAFLKRMRVDMTDNNGTK